MPMGWNHSLHVTAAQCGCGRVAFAARGAPILGVSCYCNSCQTAGRQIERLPSAPDVLDADSGTSYLLYRRDRVACARGGELLQEFRLKPDSPTKRMVATCCNSAMLLDFTKGHWLTMYRRRFPSDAPPVDMRMMTRDRPPNVALSSDVPSYKAYSGKFLWKLLSAKMAMLLGR
jgi:hypothetical protein